jgi:hypothetical protein
MKSKIKGTCDKSKVRLIGQSLIETVKVNEVLAKQDEESFETVTNTEFNCSYDYDFMRAGGYKVKPLILDRVTRRELASKAMINSSMNENKIKSFSFRQRFTNNV